MNVNNFTEIITKDPLARASTTRFRQAAGTLWVKADTKHAEKYIPILSYMDTYMVAWSSTPSTFVLGGRAQRPLHSV